MPSKIVAKIRNRLIRTLFTATKVTKISEKLKVFDDKCDKGGFEVLVCRQLANNPQLPLITVNSPYLSNDFLLFRK